MLRLCARRRSPLLTWASTRLASTSNSSNTEIKNSPEVNEVAKSEDGQERSQVVDQENLGHETPRQEIDPFDCSGNNITPELIEAKLEAYSQITSMYHLPKHLMTNPSVEVNKTWAYAIPFSLAAFYLAKKWLDRSRTNYFEEKLRWQAKIREEGSDYSLQKGLILATDEERLIQNAQNEMEMEKLEAMRKKD